MAHKYGRCNTDRGVENLMVWESFSTESRPAQADHSISPGGQVQSRMRRHRRKQKDWGQREELP